MTSQKTGADTFFAYLNRFNAIGVAILLICIVIGIAVNVWNDPRLSIGEPFGGDDRRRIGQYVGEDIQTSAGPVAAYGLGKVDESLSDNVSPNISLTHIASGKTRLIAPTTGDQQVIRFEAVDQQDREGKRIAKAYIALLADKTAYANGQMDLIVGNLPELKQVVVARDAFAIDLPTLYDNEKMAIVVWPSPSEAKLISIDLASMKITQTESIPLPKPSSPIAKAATTDDLGIPPENTTASVEF